MMQGLLPPSSSVTGVRFAAAASATFRPVAVDPVKKRWSKGRRETASATAGPPVTTATSSGGKTSAIRRTSRSAVAGVRSDGLIRTRFPAATAVASGKRASCTG